MTITTTAIYDRVVPRLFEKTTIRRNRDTGEVLDVLGKSWVYRYTIAGLTSERGLGSVTGEGRAKLSKTEAVRRAEQLSGVLATGRDPFADSVKQQTFERVYRDHLAAQAKHWVRDAEGVSEQEVTWLRWLDNDLPRLARLKFSHPSIVEEVDAAMAKVWSQKKGKDMRSAVHGTFRRAITLGLFHGDNPATLERIELLHGRGYDSRSKDKGGDVEHHRALPAAEIAAVVAKLTSQPGVAAQAAAFLILTTARTGNVLACSKASIDRAARTWTINGEITGQRMKAGGTHVYHLSDQAMAIVDRLWDLPGDLLFSSKGKQLNGGAIRDKISGKKAKGGLELAADPHGFRSTFADWVRANMVDMEDIADAILHHADGKVKAAYFREGAPAKMAAVSQAWGNFCAGIKGKEVTLRLVA